ncbi:hypothetical protein TorRG33x02_260970, partial [Trema orientale]
VVFFSKFLFSTFQTLEPEEQGEMSIITKLPLPHNSRIHYNRDGISSNLPTKKKKKKSTWEIQEKTQYITNTINSHIHKLESKNPKILIPSRKLILSCLATNKTRTKNGPK